MQITSNRRIPKTVLAIAILFGFALPAMALDATSADNLAQSLISQLGRTHGVCAIPMVGDGQLARAMVQNSAMTVHAMSGDTGAVAAAQRLLKPTGLVNTRFYASKGTPSLLPYADNFVDIIVISNLTDADLSSIPYGEIQRALCPGGKAWIGRATAEGTGITQTALQNWFNGASKNLSTAATSSTNGTWAVVTRNMKIPGTAEWSHPLGGPEGNRYVPDSVSCFPWLPQAKCKPYVTGNSGAVVVAGGRIYNATNTHEPYWNQYGNEAKPFPWLVARRIYNGQRLWVRDLTADNLGSLNPDRNFMVATDARLYIMKGAGVLELDGETGSELRTITFAGLSGNIGWIAAGNGMLYAIAGTTLGAYNLNTNAMAWTATDAAIGAGTVAMTGNRIGNGTYVLNATTGQTDGGGALNLPGMPGIGGANFGGCGPHSGSVWGQYGTNGVYGYDVKLGSWHGINYKSPCPLGVQVSNGLLISSTAACQCQGNFRGFMLEAPAGLFAFEQNAAADGSDRLEEGAAWGNVVAQVTPGTLDWPTHRGNLTRTGYSAASVSASPALLWTNRPQFSYSTETSSLAYDTAAEHEPTPPVAVGSYTFWAGTDGYVRCMDNTTSRQVWEYATGSRIPATPTVSDGCVYVGSLDGWAYCLEAHTGRLVWRFRAAPAQRLFHLYGTLASTWPIITGVLVNGGNAYFAAGIMSEYGSHVYAVNARTGALVWQNNTSDTYIKAGMRQGFVPAGYMTIIGNTLWIRSYRGRDGVFDLATGRLRALPPVLVGRTGWGSAGPTRRGREIGVLGTTQVFTGGRYVFCDQRERDFFGRGMTFGFNTLDGDSAGKYPEVELTDRMAATPAWDDQFIYITSSGNGRLTKWRIADLQAKTDSVRQSVGAITLSNWADWKALVIEGLTNDFSRCPASLWARTDITVNAVAVAANAVVATYAKLPINDAISHDQWAWYVGVLDKNTGNALWETRLPAGEPLHQGLAIDRNGSIIVAMHDGSMVCYGTGTVNVARQDVMGPPTIASVNMAPSAEGYTPLPHAGAASSPARVLSVSAVGEQSSCSAMPVSASCGIAPDYQRQVIADSSDVIVLPDGLRTHTLSPEVRLQRLQDAGNPADMSWKPETPCLPVASVISSSASGKVNSASKTLDRDLRTRWSPSTAGEQWLTYDLGAVREVSSVSLVWYSGRRQQIPFGVALSVDGRDYRMVDSGTLEGRGTSESLRTILAQDARFVRISFIPKNSDDLPSVQEVGIHGASSVTQADGACP